MTVALIFPGQGSQRHGMLDGLPQAEAVRRLIDAAEALSDIDLRAVAGFGTPAQLADTRAAQPLLYLADWAWGTEALRAGIVPAAVAGHSLGEFAALAVAGVFSVEAGLELVVERSRLMAHSAAETPGAMSAVLGLDAAAIGRAIAGIEGVWIANDNSPGQIVVSGTPEGLATASVPLMEAGARRIVPLQVSGAFHSPLMAPAAAAFSDVLDNAAFADAVFPVYQNADPTPARDAALLRERLARQITSSVRWSETMMALRQAGVTTLLECGPGAVIGGLTKRVEGLRGLSVEADGIDTVLAGNGA
jgi:[acyl-carrier-protein] S-malonyltransferase